MGENLFEEELTVEALSAMGNPLERLSTKVDFEMFRPVLENTVVPQSVRMAASIHSLVCFIFHLSFLLF